MNKKEFQTLIIPHLSKIRGIYSKQDTRKYGNITYIYIAWDIQHITIVKSVMSTRDKVEEELLKYRRWWFEATHKK